MAEVKDLKTETGAWLPIATECDGSKLSCEISELEPCVTDESGSLPAPDVYKGAAKAEENNGHYRLGSNTYRTLWNPISSSGWKTVLSNTGGLTAGLSRNPSQQEARAPFFLCVSGLEGFIWEGFAERTFLRRQHVPKSSLRTQRWNHENRM